MFSYFYFLFLFKIFGRLLMMFSQFISSLSGLLVCCFSPPRAKIQRNFDPQGPALFSNPEFFADSRKKAWKGTGLLFEPSTRVSRVIFYFCRHWAVGDPSPKHKAPPALYLGWVSRTSGAELHIWGGVKVPPQFNFSSPKAAPGSVIEALLLAFGFSELFLKNKIWLYSIIYCYFNYVRTAICCKCLLRLKNIFSKYLKFLSLDGIVKSHL